MNTEQDIYDEIDRNGARITDFSHVMPLEVPSGYFDVLAGNVMKKVKEHQEESISVNWVKEMPYDVPDGYFKSIEGKVFEAIYDEKFKPAFTDLNPIEVPANYFEELSANIISKIKSEESKTTRIIPIKHHNIWKPLKIAAAAILILGVGLGIIGIMLKGKSNYSDKELASVSKTDISEYVQQNYIEIETDAFAVNSDNNILKFESNEIVKYLNETGWEGTE